MAVLLQALRPASARVLNPVGRRLASTRISPNGITVVGTAGVVAAAITLFPRGQFLAGSATVTVFALADLLDGTLARLTGRTSQWGAFLDSTLDRVADAAIFAGIILWFVGRGADAFFAELTVFCLVAANLVSYIKARAEGLGLSCGVGIAQRGERLIVILTATGMAGFGVPYALPAGLWLLASLSVVTVVQRAMAVRRQLTDAADG